MYTITAETYRATFPGTHTSFCADTTKFAEMLCAMFIKEFLNFVTVIWQQLYLFIVSEPFTRRKL